MPERQDLTVKQASDAGDVTRTGEPSDVPEGTDTGIKQEEPGSSEEGIPPAEETTYVRIPAEAGQQVDPSRKVKPCTRARMGTTSTR